MAHLRRTEAFDINGRTYKVKALSFEDSRKAYAVIQRALPVMASEDLASEGSVLIACLTGHLSNEDISTLCEIFFKETMVDFNDAEEGKSSRLCKLSNVDVQDEIFSGSLEDMYDLLSACIDLNFKGTLGKMGAALSRMAAKATAEKAAKAQATQEKTDPSPQK